MRGGPAQEGSIRVFMRREIWLRAMAPQREAVRYAAILRRTN